MVVSIYPITEGVWSFREQPGDPVQVEVPEGSELLPVRLFEAYNLMLFVPNAAIPFVRGGWNPRQVLAEANRYGGRFKLVVPAQA